MKIKLVLISALVAFALNAFAAEPDSEEVLNTPPTKEQSDSVKTPEPSPSKSQAKPARSTKKSTSKKAHSIKRKPRKAAHSKKRKHKKKPTQ